MLQLLLAKLYDEHGHQAHPTTDLEIQDYAALGNDAKTALREFHHALALAVRYYQKYLPKHVSPKLPSKVTGAMLMEICRVFAPVKLIASRRDVIQAFYMKFAKGLYKWDLAQFFTPPTVTDFIVEVLNPQFGEHIKDPACGSADFLTAAFHRRRDIDLNYADNVWGADNSRNAVQVGVLNMLLNGDGKSNIKEVDSLATGHAERGKYDILVCNPPFGVRIVETNPDTLRKFDLGYLWELNSTREYKKTETLLDAQQLGLLFLEVCVVQCTVGGRIGIILPNGYLGNRSPRYRIARQWLLSQCRVVAICSFPRFTFKTSGADVSASVVYLEKRKKPLRSCRSDKSYRFAVEMIENVGWNLGDKKAAPRYQRNIEDGSYIIDSGGDRLLDADFTTVLSDLRASDAVRSFKWLVAKLPKASVASGWSVAISDVVADPDLTLDPKRYCRKCITLRTDIEASPHFRLGDMVKFVPESTTAAGMPVARAGRELYHYVEIQDIGSGDYRTTDLRGWELPDRAKHFVERGDLYIGSIWGSVSKWFIAPDSCKDIVVTNGCHRLRLKRGYEKYVADLVAFFCTEAYAVQMRAFARGSDGLAEVTESDAATVLIPQLNRATRLELEPYVKSLRSGIPSINAKVHAIDGTLIVNYPHPPKRPSHVVLV